jgi:hypothetical protein
MTLVVLAAGLPGCIAVVSDKPDPVYSAKIAELERRMDRVEKGLPNEPGPPKK